MNTASSVQSAYRHYALQGFPISYVFCAHEPIMCLPLP